MTPEVAKTAMYEPYALWRVPVIPDEVQDFIRRRMSGECIIDIMPEDVREARRLASIKGATAKIEKAKAERAAMAPSVIALRRAGWSQKSIAKELGTSPARVKTILGEVTA